MNNMYIEVTLTSKQLEKPISKLYLKYELMALDEEDLVKDLTIDDRKVFHYKLQFEDVT